MTHRPWLLVQCKLLAYLSKKKKKKRGGEEILATNYNALTYVYLLALVKVCMQGRWFDTVALREKTMQLLDGQ